MDLRSQVQRLAAYAADLGIKMKGRKRKAEQQPAAKKAKARKAEPAEVQSEELLAKAAEVLALAQASADQLQLDAERTERREVAFLEAADKAEKSKAKNTEAGKALGSKLGEAASILEALEKEAVSRFGPPPAPHLPRPEDPPPALEGEAAEGEAADTQLEARDHGWMAAGSKAAEAAAASAAPESAASSSSGKALGAASSSSSGKAALPQALGCGKSQLEESQLGTLKPLNP